MFTYTNPAQAGVSAKQIKKYISILEKYGLSTHSVIMARGNRIFFENYWAPFTRDFQHRQYSATKSFVAIAIGFLVQDGKLSLDDKICDHMKDFIPEDVIPELKNQTIRDMLMMSTGAFVGNRHAWFVERPDDRVKCYFEKRSGAPGTPGRAGAKIPGTVFEYDSSGSFVLGALAERLSGKSLMEYLREKLFDKIGVSEGAHFLKCPGGYDWGDSALVCTSMDLLKVARFVLNYGNVNGEQILSESYLKEATGNMINNSLDGSRGYNRFGYGYLFWRTWNDSFFFNGMGCQLAVCVPEKDFILVYNGDNQGFDDLARTVIVDRFFEEIVETAKEETFSDETEDEIALKEYCKGLKLHVADGEKTSDIASAISGKTFILNENPMKMKNIRLTFEGDEGVLDYTNEQGEKSLRFGLGKNVFSDFPQEGYADAVGSVSAPGHCYKCAVSAGWIEKDKLGIMVQVIDEYFGRMYMSVSFKEPGKVAVMCTKTAEDFMNEYAGYANGVEA